MRVALYDGILEKHVVDSLERAFASRGHEVYNTGKVGHGYEFASGKAELRFLEIVVAEVIDWAPDWVFVFRPASLPPHLMERMQRRGIKLAAWFSDDPVLFDLTYGPVVEQYDLVLHCGNAEVLRFYERQFGRPTGVNVPFWTDHDVFPRVWGTEDPASDALFLGNVQDEVRRQRYFDLAQLQSSVTVYGNVGNDYYGLSGGYLDSDAEVVAAGARARVALSVPQFFVNHRGLRTWFPGLDTLGFFEYPSRIIQYMAMGLPVVNVIPGKPAFKTFPEMIVCDSFEEADDAITTLKHDPERLQALSDATAERFDRHYSALSRVLLFEHLVEDDSWMRASLEERTAWFTQFDALDAGGPTTSASFNAGNHEEIALAGEHPSVADIALPDSPQSDSDVSPTETLGSTSDEVRLPTIAVTGMGWTDPTSRLSTIVRSLVRRGFPVVRINPAFDKKILVADPSKLSKFAVNASAFATTLRHADVLIVAGVDAALTTVGAEFAAKYGIKTIMFDDEGQLSTKRTERLATRYDVVATSSPRRVNEAAALGFTNVTLVPHFVDAAFAESLTKLGQRPGRSTRWLASNGAEESMTPGFGVDVQTPARKWGELDRAPLDEIAEAFYGTLAFASHDGSRNAPRVHPKLVLLAAANEWLVLPRIVGESEASPYHSFAIHVKEPGETTLKLHSLVGSPLRQSQLREARDEALRTTLNAEWQLDRLLSLISQPGLKVPPSAENTLTIEGTNPISTPWVVAEHVPLTAQAAIVALDVQGQVTHTTRSARIVVRESNRIVWSATLDQLPKQLVLAWRTTVQLKSIKITLEASKTAPLNRREWARVAIASQPDALTAIASPQDIVVTSL